MAEELPLRSALEIALEKAEQVTKHPEEIRVLQFGGSAIRALLETPNPYESFMSSLNILIDGKSKGIPTVLTVGGGPSFDLVKYYDDEFRFGQDVFDEMYFNAVCLNAKLLAGLLGKNGEYLTPKDIEQINLEYLLQKIPVFSHAEEPWNKTKPFSSDLQAIIIGNQLKAPTVILLRDVDGVYLWDPKADSRERLEEGALRRQAYTDYIQKLRSVVTDDDITARKVKGRKRYLIKIGGSGFDLVFYRRNPQVLVSLLSTIVDLHREYDIILTVGGGPSQDIAKRFRNDMKIDNQTYREISYHALLIHTLLVAGMLERFGEYVPPNQISKVNSDYLKEKIPVFSHIPSYVSRDLFGIEIPDSESDGQTNALGEFLDVDGIIYAKNTLGIFPHDPNIEPKLGMKDLIRRISVQDAYNLNRMGEDGMNEHLIENTGLFVLGESKRVKYVRVVDIKDPSSIKKAFEGKRVGSVIYR